MSTVIIIIAFISFFGLLISASYKMENYMDYLRLLNPEKFKGINSFKDAQLKLSNEDSTIAYAIFAPVFKRRNKIKEGEDQQVSLAAKRVVHSIYSFWIFAITFVFSFICLTCFKF